MSHSFQSVVAGTATNVTGTESSQASTVAERDSNSDVTARRFSTTGTSSGLRTGGHFFADWQAQSTNFSIDIATSTNGFAYAVTTGASTITATLPAAADSTDQLIVISKADSGAGVVVLDPNSTETVGGTTSYALYNQYDRIIIQSNGTGWDIIEEPSVLARSVAASTAVTAGSETTFSTSGHSIAANTLRVGDILEVEAQVIITSTTGSETTDIHLELGTTTIVATGALNVTNDDIAHIRATLVVRTIGASGTLVACGIVSIGVEGTATSKPFKLASTVIDTTAAITVNITCTHSSTGESARLDLFTVKRFRN